MHQRAATADPAISNASVDEILTTLNASGAGLDSLDRWAAASDIKPDRVITGPDVTYARLGGEAEGGGPVVLVYFEGVWERATKSVARTKRDREQGARAVVPASSPRQASRARVSVLVPRASRASRV